MRFELVIIEECWPSGCTIVGFSSVHRLRELLMELGYRIDQNKIEKLEERLDNHGCACIPLSEGAEYPALCISRVLVLL